MFHVEGLAVQALASRGVRRECSTWNICVDCNGCLRRFAKDFEKRNSAQRTARTEVLKKCTIPVNRGEGWGVPAQFFTKLRLGLHAAEPSFGDASIVRRRREILGNWGGVD
jgi:hypothetical protein